MDNFKNAKVISLHQKFYTEIKQSRYSLSFSITRHLLQLGEEAENLSL